MSATVDQVSAIESSSNKMSATSSPSTAPNSTPKVSIFAKKSGFVIPKNKLSGSLIPVHRGGKKPVGNDTINEDSTSQGQRKTKWGPDLTQDAAVRRGRAMAYQTRVDQITEELNLRNLEIGKKEDLSVSDNKPSNTSNDSKNSELLEIEKQEAIGEILKLNPNYKTPPDYKPLMREAIVPIPVKEYPGYNFIGLLLGPGGETQKRFEKETGAKLQVYGIKASSKEKVEISSPDGDEVLDAYEELFVHILADAFEKADAAVALIELLVTSILGNLGAGSKSTSLSGETMNAVKEQNTSVSYMVPTSVNEGVPPLPQTSPQKQFQYNSVWFSTGIPAPNVSVTPPDAALPSSSKMPSLFGPSPVPAAGYSSVLQNTSFFATSLQVPTQVLSQPYMPQMHPLDQIGQPRNFLISPLNPPSTQPNISSPLSITRPLMPLIPQSASIVTSRPQPDQPMIPTAGWSAGPASLDPSNMGQLPPRMVPSQAPCPVQQPVVASAAMAPHPKTPATFLPVLNAAASRPTSMAIPGGPPVGSFSPFSTFHSLPVSNPTLAPSSENIPRNPAMMSAQVLSAVSPSLQQGGSVAGSVPYFIPAIPPSMTDSKLEPSNSGDFTFQLHQRQNLASKMVPRPSSQPTTPRGPLARMMDQLQGPQASSFRFSGSIQTLQPGMQVFPRLVGNQMGQPQGRVASLPLAGNPNTMSAPYRAAFVNTGHIAAPSPVSLMELRNFVPAPPGPGVGAPFSPRFQNFSQPRQNHSGLSTRPGNFVSSRRVSGRTGGQQSYDPFSPTSVSVAPREEGVGLEKARKEESDTEYEDLMASVGVK